MSKHDPEKPINFLKNLVAILGLVFILGSLLKKLIKFLEKLDDDSKKWETDFGDDLEAIINKYRQPEGRSPVPRKVEPVEPVVEHAPVPKPSATAKSGSQQPSKTTTRSKGSPAFELNERQEKIYNFINSEVEVTMQDVESIESSVSTRTLRRDMNKLEKLGLIERVGRTKDSVYKLKS